MKSLFRILIAVIAVYALTIGLEIPQLFASSRIVTTAVTDKEALVALYQATDGDNWANNSNWLDNAPIGTWHGVITNRNNRIIELDLSENGLRGTLPSELGNLTNLEVLRLSENQLTGTISSELGNLTNLESLDLFENRFSGSIPSELGNLTNLEVLALFENHLRGTIPPALAELNNLRWLILSNNQLGGSIPPELGRLTNLEWLYLGDNRLSGSIPSQLGSLFSLTRLSLWGNELSGSIPPELGRLTNLEWLYLSGNRLSGWIPSALGNLVNLTSLSLWGNQLSGPFPPELDNLSGLTLLYLSDNQLTGCLPEVWRDIEENDLDEVSLQFCSDRDVLVALYEATDGDNWLESENWLSDAPIGTWYGVYTDENDRVIELDLSENDLRGTIPTELGNLTKLEALSLQKNRLRGTIPPELGNLSSLTLLFLYSNQLDGSIPTELGKLAKLEQLALSWNRLDGTIPVDLGNLVSLEVLALSGNRLRGTIPADLANLVNLQALALSDNVLTGTIPPQLDRLTGLGWLYLASNRLAGCVPEAWRDVEENDLDEVGLPICTDKDALIALYQATDGANWVNNQNWASGDPIGAWYGVTTDESGRVTELDLSQNKLSGSIPPELNNLTRLERLYLSENRLSGAIPAELGNLVNLIELELWDNKLSGTIPPELGRLANLEFLYLGDNELSGTIPTELSNLTNLEELGLHSNKLRGAIPAELGELSNLKWLFLSENRLSGPIPPELGQLTYLTELYLGDNELGGTIPPQLGNLTNLETLFLHSNQLRGAIPSELGNLTNLTGLSLWGNRLNGAIPSELGNLTKLTGLGLAENRLSGAIPPEMSNLSNLEQLYLAGNRWSGCVPAVWENVDSNDFEELDLPFCVLTASTARPTGQKLTSAQIFENVSPAIAFVNTWTGHGSGVLVEGGYIVTNAHVVWPYDTVRVVFPDGTDFRNVPVIGWDLLVDLAVLGPVDARLQPVPMLDGEQMSVGAEVYLIGYPAEVEAYPKTTMTRGILSRMREWEQVGITFFQTDASITGGQSGGALVSETGAVIGISGFKAFDEFGIAASSADLLPRIDQLVAGRDPSGLGSRQLELEGGSLRHNVTPQNYGDAYIIFEPAGTGIEIEFIGADQVRFEILDLYGDVQAEGEGGSFSFITRGHGPLFLILPRVSNEFTLSSSHRLTRFDDADLGKEISVEQTLYGNIDYPTNVDYLYLELERDEKVVIEARSILADIRLRMWGYRGESLEVWVQNENSGGGLFGLDARIVFQAPFAGEYILGVENVHPRWHAPAGYLVSVGRARRTARLTPLVPMLKINDRINVREGPGTNYAVIGTAAPGNWFDITGKSPGLGDWWQIDIGGRTGWVYAPLVTATNAQSVPVVTPPGR